MGLHLNLTNIVLNARKPIFETSNKGKLENFCLPEQLYSSDESPQSSSPSHFQDESIHLPFEHSNSV